ncbi:DEAD/DEAH box helicase family protein [Thiomicrorhabdus sp. ZW0627]|uniref:DEAD/DEAH box helicase n=1 Tax=Thiomicrorhabdus sp. ZW0627 TaxID=3039774 RepID=UPI0024363CEE|nr:DEAD/DEAH box helicase family protein [Thiomicrorhabdus sp. ZW0627]MDG6774615.1 DEAD/DEAH box helicase family protein [Thiomicrorhabdus sp. ZW0627]
MNLIKKVLGNYSKGELQALIPDHSIKFINDVSDKELTKESLINLILSDSIVSMLDDKKTRDKFISRMSESDLLLILQGVGIDIGDSSSITANTYDEVKKYAANNIEIFMAVLGISELWVSYSYATEDLPSIKEVVPQYGMYPYQKEIAIKVREVIQKQPSAKRIIHLPTGAGKTRVAMNVICDFFRNNVGSVIVWIGPSNELCNQAYEEFTKAWKALGSEDKRCYRFFDSPGIPLSGITDGLLIASIHQLYAKRKNGNELHFKQLAKNCRLIIFDEAHQIIAPTYLETVSELRDSLSSSFLLGLTATPGRGSHEIGDEDRQLSKYFEDKKITMKAPGYESPVQYLIDQGYLAQPNFFPLTYVLPEYQKEEVESKLSEKEKIDLLSNVDGRNLAIMQTVKEEYENGSFIVVFACNVQHAIDISYALNFEGIPSTYITSKTDSSESQKEKVARYKRGDVRVIVNFGILATGFDAPKTNVAVISRPTTSLVLYSQMVGRAMRGYKSGGNLECRIYTVKDDIKEFTNVNYAFVNWNINYIEE